ncbi:MAG: enoyl-CoA hydratase/isomerase family protein [Micromonosporaceae bacterium]|nr:enoyl-CoA hydratase/isomerase family protein [Micromonosporaceae bacterium]
MTSQPAPGPADPAAAAAGDPVRWERRGPVAVVTLHRPEVLNSINTAMRAGLAEAFARADTDREVRVVLVRGAGERAFCAGADITEFTAPASLAEVREQKRHSWVEALGALRKPTIAAIHGYCLGGGLELALGCDIRIAATDAVFALPEVKLGIIPGAGGTQLLSRFVGLGQALRMTLTGERIDATHAHRIGLVTDLVEPTDLAGASEALASSIADCGPVAVAYAKEAIRRGIELPLPDGLRLEADLSTLVQSTSDRLEGATAFRERRKPAYRGQ